MPWSGLTSLILIHLSHASWLPSLTSSVPLPNPRSGASAALDATGNILVVGGRANESHYPTEILRWDPVAALWSQLPVNIPAGFAFGACASLIYPGSPLVVCLSGFNQSGIPSLTVTKINSTGALMGPDTAALVSAAYFGCATIFNTVWTVGGVRSSALNASKLIVRRTVLQYSQSDVIVAVALTYPNLTTGVMCTTLSNSLLCCGGEVNSSTPGVVASCYRQFTPDGQLTVPWVVAAPLPNPRAYGCCVELPLYSRVCCFGGLDANSSLVPSVDCLNATTMTWETLPGISLLPRINIACVLWNNTQVHISGGEDLLGNSLAVHEIFHTGSVPPVHISTTVTPTPSPTLSDPKCLRPVLTVRGYQCNLPLYKLYPGTPQATIPFTINLSQLSGPRTTQQQLTVLITKDGNCSTPVPGMQPVALQFPLEGVAVATLTIPSAYGAVCVCLNDGTNGLWQLLLQNTSDFRPYFAVLPYVSAYRVYPSRPLQGETFEIRLIGAEGVIAASSSNIHDGSPTTLRISTDGQCSGVALGSTHSVLQADKRNTEPFSITSCSEPLDVAYICASVGEGWISVAPESDALVVVAIDSFVTKLSTVAAVTSAITSVLVSAAASGGLFAVTDVQTLALLGQLSCAASGTRSFDRGSGWTLEPFRTLPISADGHVNNLIGCVSCCLMVYALHGLIVLLAMGRLTPVLALQQYTELDREALRAQFAKWQNEPKARMRFPKVELCIGLFLLPGFFLSAINAMAAQAIGSDSTRPALSAAGTVAFAFFPLSFVLYLCWFIFRTTKSLPSAGATPPPNPAPVEFVPYAAPSHWLWPSHYWRSVTPAYVSLYGPLFSEFNRNNFAFTLALAARCLALAMVVGTGRGDCRFRSMLAFIVIFLYFFVLLWRRPFRDLPSNVLRSVMTLLQALVALSTFVPQLQPGTRAILIFGIIVSFLDSFWLVCRWWRHSVLTSPTEEEDRTAFVASAPSPPTLGDSTDPQTAETNVES